jgi:DNA invertase Pin-like site-specific DNA recombinase
MTMIACYCRVSSRQQKHDSQKAEIARWLKNHRIPETSVQWFEDTESGTTLRRPGFHQLQQAIFAGTIQMVIVWKLDRLSRRLLGGVNLLADWCERGIRLVVIAQQLDLSGTVGRMVASLLFGLAEIESEYRRERQAAGIAVAKRNGVYRGRHKGTTKANPARANALQARGLTVPEIANALGISVRTAFRNLAATHIGHGAGAISPSTISPAPPELTPQRTPSPLPQGSHRRAPAS